MINEVIAADRELIRRVLLLNDRNAYCDLVRKYQVAIRAYLFHLTRNSESAGDIAQETFLTGYRRLDQLKDHNKFRNWIYAIAHTQFLQWHRTQENFVNSEESGNNPSDFDGTSELGRSQGQNFFAATEVRILFKSLRPEERSALTLCLAHDFTHAETAAALNIPLGTVKTLISRARAKIGVSQ